MLQISDLTLRVAGRPLIEGASVAVPDGARIGLVGRNGAGKTTLVRAIAGDLQPDGGRIDMPKGARLGRVAQEAPGGPESLVETVLAADLERKRLLEEADTATDPHRIAEIHVRLADIGAHEAEARAARILAGLGFDHEAQQRPCSSFSGGWRMRVALAAVLFSEPDLLLLDEPTNYLDLEGTLWLERYLARYPRTAIIISHDRDLLNNAVDGIVHLFDRKLSFFRGNYDSFERQLTEARALQSKQRAKQEAERKHMEAFVERFRAKATKARQAQSRLKALARLKPIAEITEENVVPFRFPDPARRLSPPILRLSDVSVGYEPGRPVLTRLDLRIDDDDRIALLGANGNGKSTFAKLVAGRLEAESGEVVRAPKLEVGLFAQHQLEALDPARSAYDHVRALMPGASEAQIRSRVARMGLSTEKMATAAGDLSGGEKARLMMGIAAFGAPNLLILDEPTNHLDIDSREALVHALNDYEGAVILISHDRHLLEACADRLWLVDRGTVKPFDGDLDDYRRLVLSRADGEAAASAAEDKGPSQKALRRQAAERREALAPLRKKIKDSERLIEKLQGEVKALDGRLADPALYGQPDRAATLAQERAQKLKALARAEESWLALSEEEAALQAG
ncbi:ABC-F family ATP-binding cassette domain-containing protein [Faunimonas sp. B44]|uniref:ABC-F family ATP-binding cassette domain-containing protein n=1 Tax=Faunimonas sp. B44 TaxID=3461493 RepID=UPI0040440403